MALVLAVGFVVDDAIVMLENIVRHLELGESVMEASLNGSREISFTILSMTLSLAAVFIPVLFMGGIMGRLLHEFSVAIMSAVLVSGLVSLTLTPMLCSRFCANQTPRARIPVQFLRARPSGNAAVNDRSLQIVLRFRLVTLRVLRHRWANRLAVRPIPKGFLPSEDSGFVFGITMAQQGISFDSMKEHQQAVTSMLLEDPNVLNTMSFAGGGGPGGGGISGFFFLALKSRPSGREQMLEWAKDLLHIPYPRDPKYRYLTTDQVIQSLRPSFSRCPAS